MPGNGLTTQTIYLSRRWYTNNIPIARPVPISPPSTTCRNYSMDAELARLVAKARGTHGMPLEAAAPTATVDAPSKSRKRKADDSSSAPAKRKLPSAAIAAARPKAPPSFAEREQFMSASSSRVHMPVSPGDQMPTKPVAIEEKQKQRLEFKNMALSVEMFGATKLAGLSKKDQKARERERLGLRPERDHKRPYKQV